MAKVQFDVLRKKNATGGGAITASYTTFGTALTQNWREFKITNNTDGDMFISVDGTNDHMFVPAFSFTLYDLATNSVNVQNSDWFVMGIATQFYIKYSSAPTKGTVYLEALFSTGV